MNPWRWVDPRVREVRLSGVRAYLETLGWQLQPNPNPDLLRFEAPPTQNGSGPPFYVLPSSERAADYVQSITYFITTMSEAENRHPVTILEEILQATADSHARTDSSTAVR